MNGKFLDKIKYLIMLIVYLFLFLIFQSHHITKYAETRNYYFTGIHPQELSLFVSSTESVTMNTTHTQTQISHPIELIKATQNGNAETGNQAKTENVKMTISIKNEETCYLESTPTEVILTKNIDYSLTRSAPREDVEQLANNEISIGDQSRPIVIMTYDDGGPSEYIEHIMSVYEAFNSRATFFITGVWAEKNRDLVKDMIDRGFTIGCHGWDHSEMTSLSKEAVRKQLIDFLALMNQIDENYDVRFIRFPYGSRNQCVRAIAAEFGLQSVMWSCGSGGQDANTLNNILRCLKNGSIVLSHSTRWYDVYQTEEILQTFVDFGYEVVSINDGITEFNNTICKNIVCGFYPAD